MIKFVYEASIAVSSKTDETSHSVALYSPMP